MRGTWLIGLLVAAIFIAAVHSNARADEGMWLLNRPPVKLLKEKYGFEPPPEWLEHLQKSCVRFSTGGSGSIVSANGLVMTNHHVGSDCLEELSTPERNLLETGFHAKSRDEELRCLNIELLSLWSIEDVTERVLAAVDQKLSAAEAHEARRKMMAAIEEEAEKKTSLDCKVITLYQGARFHLYSYKRFTDIRLVMAPEQKIAFFGGDNDNFEFPRFDLDICFFRIYENDKPLDFTHHLAWSKNGSAAGDLVFVCGNPGTTQRLYTVEHLKFLRDVEFPATLENLWRREVQLQGFASRSDEHARIASGDLFSVQNSRKANTGILGGLLSPALFRAKETAEHALRQSIAKSPEQNADWGQAWDDIAKSQAKLRTFYQEYSILEGRRGLRSDLLRIARNLVRLAAELPKPSGERFREYRDSELDSLYLGLYSPAPIYDLLEVDRMASGLARMAETLGGGHPLVQKALAGHSPRDRAEALVNGSRLEDVAFRKELAEGGQKAIDARQDPLIRFAAEIDSDARALRKRYEDEIEGVERIAYAKIAAAHFAVKGEDMYPDATFTLRLAFGTVKGYREGGKDVAPYTNLGGAYERMAERKGREPFALTERWLERKSKLDLATPYNFVCTADIIGGNSGSPVLNRAGEVVGIIFDGNIQGLISDIAYTEEQARAVAVDSRGIIECLRKIYDAGALADELTR